MQHEERKKGVRFTAFDARLFWRSEQPSLGEDAGLPAAACAVNAAYSQIRSRSLE